MHKLALRAVAKFTHVDIANAAQVVRQNPILEDEINIEEELINLQESLDGVYAAGDTLCKYPSIHQHIISERRLILKHCIGLIARMLYGKKLPRPYTPEDTEHAMRKLVQLIVDDARRTGKRMDEEMVRILRPFMNVRQRLLLRQWGMDLVMEIAQVSRFQSLYGKVLSLRPNA